MAHTMARCLDCQRTFPMVGKMKLHHEQAHAPNTANDQ